MCGFSCKKKERKVLNSSLYSLTHRNARILKLVSLRVRRIPDGFFIPLPFAITLFFVIYVFLCKNFTGSFCDGEMLFLYFAVLGIIKAVYDIIRLIKIKRYTLIPICLLSLAGTFLCFFSPYLYEEYRIYTESISAPPFLNL